jgi:transcriptional regulator with XRE-family HTH domain
MTNPRKAVAKKALTLSSAESEVTPSVRIASARRVFGSDSEVASALGVARSQLSRWKSGQFPDEVNRDRLVALDVVVELLSGYLSAGSIHKWLNSPNAHLADRRPLAVIRANRLSEVIAAIEAEKSGAFA